MPPPPLTSPHADPLAWADPTKAVTLFAFKDYFPAVATTDVISRVADVLCCKPSELAFYPVPKANDPPAWDPWGAGCAEPLRALATRPPARRGSPRRRCPS